VLPHKVRAALIPCDRLVGIQAIDLESRTVTAQFPPPLQNITRTTDIYKDAFPLFT
jgi:hypothetical protein